MRKLLCTLLWTLFSCGAVVAEPCTPKLEISSKTTTSITLKWECKWTGAGPHDGYMIDIRSPRGSDSIMGPDANVYTQTIDNLICGEMYEISIRTDSEDYNFTPTYSNVIITTLGEPVYPVLEEFVDVQDTSVALKLDQWKTGCPIEKFYTRIGKTVKTSNVSVKRLLLTDLQPNTDYTLFVWDHVDKENNPEQYRFRTLCGAKVPESPSKKDALNERDNSVTVALAKFSNCYTSFTAEYRDSENEKWTLIAADIKPEQKYILIQQLTPGTLYKLRITGHFGNRKGINEYEFSPTKKPCGDWIQYKTKCIKVVDDAGFLMKNDARLVCQQMQESVDIPSLLTISSQKEMEFVFNALHGKTSGAVWLGLQSDDNGIYHWDNGSHVKYSGWNNETVEEDLENEEEMKCGKLNVRSGRIGWDKVSCQSRNYVVCEKPHPWPLQKLRKEFEKLQQKLESIEKRLAG